MLKKYVVKKRFFKGGHFNPNQIVDMEEQEAKGLIPAFLEEVVVKGTEKVEKVEEVEEKEVEIFDEVEEDKDEDKDEDVKGKYKPKNKKKVIKDAEVK